MVLTEQTLEAVSFLSAELAAAEHDDDAQRLAALVAACRAVEQRALTALASRLTAVELLAAQTEALLTLGW